MTPTDERQKLGLFDATMLVMGGIIGVGIFFTPAQVASHVPVGWAFFGMWFAGGLIAMCGAMTFAELGGTFPRAGGWFEFLREIYGAFVAFLFAWVILGVVATGAIAVIAGFGAEMLLTTFGVLDGEGSVDPRHKVMLATGILIAMTGLVLGGIKLGATFQNVCMIAKLTAMAALVVAGLLFFAPAPAPEASVSVAPIPTGATLSMRGVIAATLPVFFAFGGWQHVCYIADAVRDPQRTVPRAVLLGVLGVACVYFLVNLAYVRVLGVDGVASIPNFAAEVAERSFGAGGARALQGAMAVSAIGVCAVNVIVTPTIFVGMAKSGLFFKSFAKRNARGAPTLALVVQLVLALAYLAWAHSEMLFGWASERMNPSTLTDSVVFAEWVFHGLTAYGLIRLRSTRPDLPRPYKSLWFPLAPVIYLVVAVGILGGNLKNAEWSMTGVGLGVLAIGAVVYWPWRGMMARRRSG